MVLTNVPVEVSDTILVPVVTLVAPILNVPLNEKVDEVEFKFKPTPLSNVTIEPKLAVGAVVLFLKIPVPLMACALLIG